MRQGVIAALSAVVLLVTSSARAGHPMLSEDTGTQGVGNYEMELGFDWSHLAGVGTFLFQPQLSIGASPTLDLIVQPSWLKNSGNADHAQGFGDSNLDFKWRFYGASPLTLGIRAGLEVPTDQHRLGLPGGQISEHGILVATIDAEPWSFDFNAGYAYLPLPAPARTKLYHFSGAALFSVNEHLALIVESSADGDPDPSEPACECVALAGMIYTVHPGLDIDAGYRAPLTRGTPAQQWLLGVTFRGAL